jgi:hypothetical protein
LFTDIDLPVSPHLATAAYVSDRINHAAIEVGNNLRIERRVNANAI